MRWKDHSKDFGEGDHALLGCSNYSWVNYDDNKLQEAFKRKYAQAIGTRVHEYAAKYIKYGQRPKSGDKTGLLVYLFDSGIPAAAIDINRLFDTWLCYVKDCVKLRMRPEQRLFYSENAFGTADSISFRNNRLMIFDLKTGETKASMIQLYLYDALFCLDYGLNPSDLDEIVNRIYQKGDFIEESVDPIDILNLMDKIKHGDEIIDYIKRQGEYDE